MQQVVAKYEERVIMMHEKFEAVSAKYWQLMTQSHDKDISKETLTKEQYTALLTRIYRVLAPLYRPSEMAIEVA